MALMFQRLARNFIKNGYFPTDEKTTEGILSLLNIKSSANTTDVIRVIDPCCGEGVILSEIKHHLLSQISDRDITCKVEAVGIEIDEERAYHAKSELNLDTVVHGNISDCYIGSRQFGLMILNPPYGKMLSDNLNNTNSNSAERYETYFYEQTNKLLRFGGVLVFIVPNYCLNKSLATKIASHFDKVSIYAAPEQKFKQIVVFGVRTKAKNPDKLVIEKILSIAEDINKADTLLATNTERGAQYCIPCSENAKLNINQLAIDRKQLEFEIQSQSGLWNVFNTHFTSWKKQSYSPLNQMSNWHLSLALAAGKISGIVTSKNGRSLLVKGRTFKDKKVTTEVKINETNGSATETTISTDIFVPSIRAIDLTKGSAHYGDILTIK